MKNEEEKSIKITEIIPRRKFIQQGIILAVAGSAGISLLESCSKKEDKKQDGDKDKDKEKDKGKDDKGEEDVSPPEDLMREHGLLNRILLIYDLGITRLGRGEDISLEALGNAAGIVKSFVEDYHEKQEEDYLFPRFEKANKLTDLVKILKQQHDAGRGITAQIIQMAKSKTLKKEDSQKMVRLLSDFNRMYRPHEAREDTILFPELRKIVSSNEFDSMGEEFEKNEEKQFGKDGFESMVDKVAGIEKQLGIYELSQFTPKE